MITGVFVKASFTVQAREQYAVVLEDDLGSTSHAFKSVERGEFQDNVE
jgi:hypothetical protein